MICKKCKREIPSDANLCPYCGRRLAPDTRKALKRANGMGTVYKLQGQRLRRPWVAAKRRVILGYYDTKTAALEALERVAAMDLTEKYNMTFAQVFAAWKEEHYREITAAGIATYNRAFDVFKSLHERKFRALRTADFQRVMDAHAGKTHSTLSKYKQLLTQMSRWAMREEIITTNFATYVRLPENVRKEKEIFTAEEIAALESASGDSDAAKITLMLIYTGMRIGELFNLPLSDYHETYVVGGEKTAAGRNRVIPIRPEGRAYFAYFAAIATGDLLLSGYAGNQDTHNFRTRDYYPLLKRLGIRKISPHATRHTYASEARRMGMPPEILQRILGHASYSTTANIYVHTEISTLIAAVEAPSRGSETFSNAVVTENGLALPTPRENFKKP